MFCDRFERAQSFFDLNCFFVVQQKMLALKIFIC